MKTPFTTLCYIESGGCWLMLHRDRKKDDVNEEKWIGIGGHFEEGESPEECLKREALEETGFRLEKMRMRGLVTFSSEGWGTEYMALFTAELPGEYGALPALPSCPEGELAWVPVEKVETLNLWEGDRIFLRLLLKDTPFFSLKLSYDTEGNLVETALNGEPLKGMT